MAGDSDENVGTVAETSSMDAVVEENTKDDKKSKKGSKKKKGFFSRIWNGLFGSRNDDYERRLERISKEEKAIINKMRKRAQRWGSMKRHIIIFSILMEVRFFAFLLCDFCF